MRVTLLHQERDPTPAGNFRMDDAQPNDRCADLLKAIADPDRLKIIQYLADGAHSVGEIAEAIDEKMVNVSHHLGVLRHAGFVIAKKQGRFVAYALSPEFFPKQKKKSSLQVELGCCCLTLSPNSANALRIG
jgi:DNA-binding transcriptional ArsR family regulator